jgi:P2 family phage contractile tail tube protein
MAVIPDKAQNAKVYLESNVIVGVASAELPKVEFLSDKMSPLGIAGEVETPTIGHFKGMKAKLKFTTTTKDFAHLFEPKSKLITVYGSLQQYDPASGTFKSVPLIASLNTLPLSLNPGKLEMNKPQDSEIEFTVTAYKLEVNGKVIYEIDILNHICIVNGKDYSADIRRNLGMG